MLLQCSIQRAPAVFFVFLLPDTLDSIVLQNLSQRLERNIANMMISNGDGKKLRERRRMRRPLEEAQREVLREKSLEADREDLQQVKVETHRARQEARDLRSKRMSSDPGAADIIEILGGDVSRTSSAVSATRPYNKDYDVFDSEPSVKPQKFARLERTRRPRVARAKFDEVGIKTERELLVLEEQEPADVLQPMREQHRPSQSGKERFDENRRLYTAEVMSVTDSPQSSERDLLEDNQGRHTEMVDRLTKALIQEQKQRREDERRHADEVNRLSRALLHEQEQRERDQQHHAKELERIREAQNPTRREHKAHRSHQRKRSPHAATDQRRASYVVRPTSQNKQEEAEEGEELSNVSRRIVSHKRHSSSRVGDVHLRSQRVERKRQSMGGFNFF